MADGNTIPAVNSSGRLSSFFGRMQEGVTIPGSDDCKNCTQKKRTCVKGECYRFCPVLSVRFNAGENIGAAQQELEFSENQTWVDIPTTLKFLPPNAEDDEDISISGSEEYPIAAPQDANIDSSGSTLSLTSADRPRSLSYSEQQDASGSTGFFSTVLDSPSNITSDLAESHDIIDPDACPIGVSASAFSAFSPNISLGHPAIRPDSPLLTTHSSLSQTSPFSSRWPVKNRHEARLFHHYIVHCSPWIDICDPKCHWAKEVPKRAAHFQVILNGVLALAARHLFITGDLEEDLSEPYVSDSLHTLIVALEDPLAHWDENFLVAVILLRLHEEIGEIDERCHHLGASRIINTSSSFAADGGLRESASWVSLRQHIYVSLTTQRPLDLSLENYRCSSIFRESHEEAWANRIIFCFAHILKNVFENDTLGRLSQEKWTELDAEVDEWDNTKPWTFAPLAEDQFVDKNIEPGRAQWHGEWPELLVTHPAQAVGLQYFHLCKIMLTFYNPRATRVGLTSHRSRIVIDGEIRKHMRMIFGYAKSNNHVKNAQFQVSHILAACGAYLTDAEEQDAAVEYLISMKRTTGWKTDHVIKDLREQWKI
ncbi:uncharacterized protein GGS22DRAFT_189401 [Annulohypoxylon maeteangense]|uniref:uncharacterized protein n=1 Tax=Annulohypoxylon maeteangense TaxID=1927788 RepID=UPI002007F09F|nr:uncharacterized protein GGS22DRAFT_189401 [Annulohypoxylon maeteangense]KAI0884272.1 hypothetical protein GGS22DRAFT_189401 [Annulohypoxylon maeteangense]